MATRAPATPPPRPPDLAPDVLLQVNDLRTYFHTDDGVVRAVDGVSFTLRKGTTLGIVGESGCGKTMLARSLMRIAPEPPARITGEILWRGKSGETVDLARYGPHSRELREVRGREIAMIFQEPMSSLSPVHTIGNQIMEALTVHQKVSKDEARARAIEMIGAVGIPRPETRLDAYTFELSGGMRQRAMIAMALMCRPDLLIADEPTTALDVTVQAAILDLMRSLQAEMGMSIAIITHDLGVVARMAKEVVVMYLGRIVEHGTVEQIFEDPQHPYTQALLRSMPRLGPRRNLEPIRGSVPDPYHVPPGCPFFPRCPEAQAGRCDTAVPDLVRVDTGHDVRCVMREEAPHA